MKWHDLDTLVVKGIVLSVSLHPISSYWGSYKSNQSDWIYSAMSEGRSICMQLHGSILVKSAFKKLVLQLITLRDKIYLSLSYVHFETNYYKVSCSDSIAMVVAFTPQ